MKKIINKIGIAFIALLAISCQNEKKDSDKNANETIPQPQHIVGIGKITPSDGIALLSVTQTSKVTKIYKKLGDKVKAGDILFDMESIDESLDIKKNQTSLQTAQANLAVNTFDIKKAQIQLAELKKEYNTSKALYNKNAETAEKLFKDSIAYHQQLALIDQYQQQQTVQKSMVKEREMDVEISKNKLYQKAYSVLQDGTITLLDLTVGQILTPNEYFGEIASDSDLIIEGELDEYYASQLALGQKVEITLVGQSQVIASGEIIYVGDGLQNKSILYETKGEANDRRVRRFSVKIINTTSNLLINQKVECKIYL